jgi:transposase
VYYLLGTKNRQTKITTRIKLNANGYQAVNGNSLILFQPNTRTFEEIKSLIQLRIVNCEKDELISKLKKILADERLDETEIYNQFKAENTIDTLKNEFNEFIANNNSSEEQFLVKIRNKANKLNPEKHTNIENIQKEIIIELLNKETLINDLQKERKIVVILDNYSVHKANLVIQASEILNIKLIRLPVHSPHLNPIEQVWKTIKKHMANYLFDTIEFMEELFENEFYRIVNNESYYKNWIKKFINFN